MEIASEPNTSSSELRHGRTEFLHDPTTTDVFYTRIATNLNDVGFDMCSWGAIRKRYMDEMKNTDRQDLYVSTMNFCSTQVIGLILILFANEFLQEKSSGFPLGASI